MEHTDLNIFETKLDETAKAHLLETTRWTKFLGISYTILMLLFFFYIVFAMTYMSRVSVGTESGPTSEAIDATVIGMIIGMLISMGLIVYPIYALFKFSSGMKRGLQTNDQELINDGFRYQKTMYRYLGIMTIISLALTLLGVILGGIGIATS